MTLTKERLAELKNRANYWKEVMARDNKTEADVILAQELLDVMSSFGSKLILEILMEYAGLCKL